MKDGAVYEDMMDFKALKKYMEDQLEDYNMEPGVIAMDLVLFRDAIEHGMNNHHFLLSRVSYNDRGAAVKCLPPPQSSEPPPESNDPTKVATSKVISL